MLRFSSVTYTYPHAAGPAVRGISFRLSPGEAMLCTGRSGCGKTTLIRLANGLAPHYLSGNIEGDVLAAGKNTLRSHPAELAQSVGTLFQDPERQFFGLTVEAEIALGLQWRGWEPAKVRDAASESAAILGIESLLERIILGLSEGQKQKVALAALLATRPRLLVLDEPSANLDPESTAELARTLQALKNQGIALFIVDHRLSWMRGVADKVLVLDNGETVASGDFSLLEDAGLRERHGLRDAAVADARERLPDMSGPDDTAFFSCRGISFAYPRGKPIFENKSVSFAPGRIIALVGENGVGKTTLARLLTGLETPACGEVLAGGVKVKPRKLPSHAQVVLQNAGHQLRMNSVAGELKDACDAGTAPEARDAAIKECMERYRIAHLAARHPQSLSGGEQQRLAVACAALRRPRMLILDEPTSGLDGENMRRMADSMRRAADDGACLLVITHDLELMNRVCTERIVLHKPSQERVPHDNAAPAH